MKNLIILLTFCALTFCACTDNTSTPNATTEESSERKGGNNKKKGGKKNNTLPPTIVYMHPTPTDWNISVDTVPCGYVIVRWDAQPNAARYYVTDDTPVYGGCSGPNSYTNTLYYLLGAGCSWFPGNTYNIKVSYDYFSNDTIYYHQSLPYTFTSGSFFVTACP